MVKMELYISQAIKLKYGSLKEFHCASLCLGIPVADLVKHRRKDEGRFCMSLEKMNEVVNRPVRAELGWQGQYSTPLHTLA